jgi:tRNA(fMet)-specific endonuclease VapC
MFMLDTNTCIFIQKRVPAVLERFQAALPHGVCVSAITVAELEFGIAKSTRKEESAQALSHILALAPAIPCDLEPTSAYGRIRAYLKGQGSPIGPLDTLIAAHALSRGCTLVTNNTREFSRVPGLPLTDWR